MRNELTASATDTAMRNSWNEKKNTNVNWLTLEEQVHVLSKFWGFYDYPIPDVP